ncbi:MAG: hypothetical protein ACE361_15125 [Aureliella sp.]
MHSPPNHESWHVARRWHSYEGEIRVSILRLAIVLTLYSIHLVTYFFLTDSNSATDTATELTSLPAVDQHRIFTFLAAGGLVISLAVLVSLRQRFFPWFLPYCVTSCDTGLVFAAAFFGAKIQSPMVMCLVLIVAMAAMRFSLRLVWFSSLLALAAYFGLVGTSDSKWFDADHVTPLNTQMISTLIIVSAGIIAGQIVRMTRSAAELYTSHATRPATGVDEAESSEEKSP